MAMLTENHDALSAGPTDVRRGNAATEIVTRVASTKGVAGNEPTLSAELAALATMAYSDLHLAWRRHYRAIPPKKISRDILKLGIAWKIQENRFGGLGVSVKRQIAELARIMETDSDLAKPRTISCKPGARLLRAWDGVTHEVVVVEDGFLWAGKTWRSLSAIAREMTGTRWSGPRFFGLNATAEQDSSGESSKVSGHE